MSKSTPAKRKTGTPVWIMALFGLLVGAVLGYVLKPTEIVTTSTTINTNTNTSIQNTNTAPTVAYKTVRFLTAPLLTVSIPETWSGVNFPEREQAATAKLDYTLPVGSIAKNDVKYGDLAWSQIDFYYTERSIEDLVADKTAESPTATWTTEIVGGFTAQVATEPIEGLPNKGATGGKTYIMTLPALTGGKTYNLVIVKQAQDDAAFEQGFTYMLNNIKVVTYY